LVFDPLWDIDPYLQMAQQREARIRYVMDSHTHADHVSGARRLIQATDAELLLPRLAEATYAITRVDDGDTLRMGEVTLTMVATPGHRPEGMSLLITDHSRSDSPWCLLTGDSLLVGDMGRPDLGQVGREGAYELFDRTLPRLRMLPDYVEIYPGHVAGSTCGRVMSGKTNSTIGYEQRFNPMMQVVDRELFAVLMNANQPARPANMVNIEAINQGKRPLTMKQPIAPGLLPQEAAKWLAGGALALDVRSADHFAAGHLPGAYHVPLDNANFEQWVGWILPSDTSLILVAMHEVEIQLALQKLAFLGLDSRVKGYWQGGMNALPAINLTARKAPRLTVQQLHTRLNRSRNLAPLQVLDVRECAEWEAGHIAQAHHMNFKHLGALLTELDLEPADPVAVVCRSGVRSAVACSILLHNGYTQVYNVVGGMNAWQAAGLPVTGSNLVAEQDLTLMPVKLSAFSKEIESICQL
jgi:rhodanese-related sulfurtransferase/glyoxylase-like metal-dependent hydrolase (beta-lactamase superfamily II)